MNFSLKFRVSRRRFNCALNFAPVQPQCICSTLVHLFNASTSDQRQCICSTPVHLFEVGFAFERLAPGAVRVCLGHLVGVAERVCLSHLVGIGLAGPSAALRRPLQPHRLLVVVRFERTRQFVAAACT